MLPVARIADCRKRHQIWGMLPRAPEINIEPLAEIGLSNRYEVAPWQWGKQAAKRARTYFGIAAADPQGGHAFFDKLGIDPSSAELSTSEGSEAGRLSGGLKRDEVTLHILSKSAARASGQPGRATSTARHRDAGQMRWLILDLGKLLGLIDVSKLNPGPSGEDADAVG